MWGAKPGPFGNADREVGVFAHKGDANCIISVAQRVFDHIAEGNTQIFEIDLNIDVQSRFSRLFQMNDFGLFFQFRQHFRLEIGMNDSHWRDRKHEIVDAGLAQLGNEHNLTHFAHDIIDVLLDLVDLQQLPGGIGSAPQAGIRCRQDRRERCEEIMRGVGKVIIQSFTARLLRDHGFPLHGLLVCQREVFKHAVLKGLDDCAMYS